MLNQWFPLTISLLALVYVAYLAFSILRKPVENKKMKEIASAIQEGSVAFLSRQYKTIAILTIVIALIIAFVIKPQDLAITTAIAFVIGATCSALAGYISMYVAVRANVRTAEAAQKKGLNAALQMAFRGGAVMGLSVISLSLLGVTVLYFVYGNPMLMIGLGFGASFVALFAQLGGGIYTKAADVGADLVGKVEKGIPEDDARNPAVIADNVGDNVGDCAGRGADLFESATAENIGAMILGVALMPVYGIGGVLFPLVARAAGIIASTIGFYFVSTKENGDAMKAMNKGLYVASFICAIMFYFLVQQLLGGNMNLYYASLVGLATSLIIASITEHYTSKEKHPVQEIARSSETGSATNFLAGFSVALEATAAPVVVMCAAILISYYLGGLYGTAVATIGMLATAAFVLAMDGYGPIADNAGGIGEMAGVEKKVKTKILDHLDSVGNTTKALTKGYAMSSAALSAFLLFSAYLETAGIRTVDLAVPKVFVGAFIGVMLPYLFSSYAIKAVSRAAYDMVNEVRRQFKEKPGIMKWKVKPDYGRCVDISTSAALREMVLPGVLVVATPILIGLVLGAESVGAFLMGATMSGIVLAMLMNTGGASWDNAKKHIEDGYLGGKGTAAHAAAVAGDTVGDPFKDTAGPSLHVLVKLINTIALVFVPLFAK